MFIGKIHKRNLSSHPIQKSTDLYHILVLATCSMFDNISNSQEPEDGTRGSRNVKKNYLQYPIIGPGNECHTGCSKPRYKITLVKSLSNSLIPLVRVLS